MLENTVTDEPAWKKLRLSIERPYKNDNGDPIPTLLDITPEGQHIYEPKVDLISSIGENLRRIFVERGHDFFDRTLNGVTASEPLSTPEDGEPDKPESSEPPQAMTPEDLLKMRMELIPQLHVALGEMSQARDLLSLLLLTESNSSLFPDLPQNALVSSTVTKPPPITSVQAFNTQLVIGGKDMSLRKASSLFKTAASNIESSRIRGDKYWVDALNLRKGNWGLVPAPLPFGSATGKGADKTAKDFLVSFGLEESPTAFRRRAIGKISTFDEKDGVLEFPLRQRTRLRVSIVIEDTDGKRRAAHNSPSAQDDGSLQSTLRAAQAEVVEQEIFAMLIKEAGNLPTASARVSERLIVIEAAQATELCFELVDSSRDDVEMMQGADSDVATCDLILSALRILLLRAHASVKRQLLARDGSSSSQSAQAAIHPPPLLQPVVDILQYRVFCKRVRAEFDRVAALVRAAGLSVRLRFSGVSECGEDIIALIKQDRPRPVGGEALLRIDERQTLRFTFVSPSLLVAHLAQATLNIVSIPQLSRLLVDEIKGCIMNRIREVGSEYTESVNGTWFIDPLGGRVIGRWEHCVLTFWIGFSEDSISCVASRCIRGDGKAQEIKYTYSSSTPQSASFVTWIQRTIQGTTL